MTGVVDSDLSSAKSKRGDVFAVVLEHGFAKNGKQIIPSGSRILGAVVDAFPAKMQRSGMPGRLTVSLQTLAFPDGRTTKFSGFIAHNPAHDQEQEPKTKFSGFGLGDYGQSVKGMLGSFASGIGFVHANRLKGKEFSIKEGTQVAIKLNRRLDLASMSPPVGSVPGLTGSLPPGQGMSAAPTSWFSGKSTIRPRSCFTTSDCFSSAKLPALHSISELAARYDFGCRSGARLFSAWRPQQYLQCAFESIGQFSA